MNPRPLKQRATGRRRQFGASMIPLLLALAVLLGPPALLLLEPRFGHLVPGDSALQRLATAWVALWAALMLAAAVTWWAGRRRQRKEGPPLALPPETRHTPSAPPPTPRSRPAEDMQLTTGSVLELVNQQWVTPLGHIRSAVDSLASLERRLSQCAPPASVDQQEPARSLQLMRHASHRLRISIENIIDYHEISAGRLKRTDGRVNPRTTGEDMVADWQTTAQSDGEVLQFIGYQDLPREIALDPQMLRRLLDRQLNEALCIGHLKEPAVIFQIEDEYTTEGGDSIGRFRLTVDGRSQDHSFGREALTARLGQSLSDSLGDLLVDDLIDIWIMRSVGKHLGATLEVLDTGNGRTGLSAVFEAPVLTGEPEPGELLSGKLCGVVCASAQHRRAWQGNLASLGADIQVEPDFGQPVDLLFLDERIVERHHKDPAFSEWVKLAGRVVGLASRLTIRGRPAGPLHWADFTLPLFIRGRALAASLERILDTAGPAPGKSQPRLAPKPDRPDVARQAQPRPQPRQARSSASSRHALYSFAGRTALVIDDDPVYLAHLTQTLGELGFTVLEAGNGKQALEVADHADIDIVFTDMHMPDITGAGVARILKKRARHLETPIIAITANRQGNVHQDLLNSGIERVLTKPVTAGELLSAVGEFFPLHNHTRATPASERPAATRDPFLTRLLLDELPGYRRLLTEQADDPDALRHAAHKLRGAAACCRETALQERAGVLETALDQSQDANRIRGLIDELLDSIHDIESTPVPDGNDRSRETARNISDC
ncbi:response regulator [Guyparkeria sp.]|uniref:response regulator n=1 Tax=Guyparkeria sp. TaxID=2035736 RepID=UPI003568CA03